VRPEIEYAQAESASIAYQTVGRGPLDLVFVPGFVSHLDLAWEEPFLARFLRGLAAFSRLVWFDKQGTGLSDPTPDAPPLDAGVAEIGAVMDAAGSERAALFGVAVGAARCVRFALRHPERVSALVLFAGQARLLRDDDYPSGWSEDVYVSVLERLGEGWPRGDLVELMNPSLAGDERFRSWFRRYCRAGARLSCAASSSRVQRSTFGRCSTGSASRRSSCTEPTTAGSPLRGAATWPTGFPARGSSSFAASTTGRGSAMPTPSSRRSRHS
jgi:pimeloyl-ACP methyl ester carboxylesterase